MILIPLQKFPNNVGDLGKIFVATSFEWLPKVQKIAKSGHNGGTQKIMMSCLVSWISASYVLLEDFQLYKVSFWNIGLVL